MKNRARVPGGKAGGQSSCARARVKYAKKYGINAGDVSTPTVVKVGRLCRACLRSEIAEKSPGTASPSWVKVRRACVVCVCARAVTEERRPFDESLGAKKMRERSDSFDVALNPGVIYRLLRKNGPRGERRGGEGGCVVA